MNTQENKKLENALINRLKSYITKKDTIVAGISGGPDSIFLLHFLKQIPCKLIVAHVNHMLRKESDRDKNFVSKMTEKSPTAIFHPLKANIKLLSQKTRQGLPVPPASGVAGRQGLEETGRKIRYDFFKKLAKKYHAKFIITAPHPADNLETVIFNFARGAGMQGLIGMEEIEKNKPTSLLRPLLSISKKQILDYLKFHKIKYCTDKTNADTFYKRNFIRHKIIPLFKKLNPNFTEIVAKNIKNIKEIHDHINQKALDWIAKNSTRLRRAKKNQTEFNAKNFRKESPALQKIILLNLYKNHVGNLTDLESKHLTEALTLINNNIGNKKKAFGKLTIFLENSQHGLLS